ncbi:MAG: hypothetical protein CMH62_02305, partial [Nanoarchaeota archaeon]|nr:hypothetical protein [Nanoarchaeota archaeon]
MKRGQAGNIATLISLIALFMLVYILLLPQEARDELLNRDGERIVLPGVDSDIEVLFSKDIGEVSPLRQSKGIIHTIAGVNLFSDVENEIVTLANDVFISRGVASGNSQEFVFPIDSPRDVENAEILVIVGSTEGNMIVTLNGREIFNAEVRDNSQELIVLPIGNLQEVNVVEFKSANPGGLFWKTNTHVLREIKLRKRFEI